MKLSDNDNAQRLISRRNTVIATLDRRKKARAAGEPLSDVRHAVDRSLSSNTPHDVALLDAISVWLEAELVLTDGSLLLLGVDVAR